MGDKAPLAIEDVLGEGFYAKTGNPCQVNLKKGF